MSEPLPDAMLDLSVRLAREAAGIALPQLGRAKVARKADDSVVTEVDHRIQEHIITQIRATYPDHAIRAEEAEQDVGPTSTPAESRFCWVIDPLDGTRNFASALPCFATSIAVLDRGRPVVGVVLEHNLGHLYKAAAGKGAWFNDARVRVEEVPPDCDTLIGIPSSKGKVTVDVLRSWVPTRGLILRNLGSTALHLAMVASGTLAAAFSWQCKIWDIAAGALLVEEAGGRITDLAGAHPIPFDLSLEPNRDLPVLAAAPAVHSRLMDSIRDLVA